MKGEAIIIKRRLITALKYVAIFLGFSRMARFIIFESVDVQFYIDNISTLNNASTAIGLIMTYFIMLFEKNGVMYRTDKRSKWIKIFIIILTLGLILILIRKKRGYV